MRRAPFWGFIGAAFALIFASARHAARRKRAACRAAAAHAALHLPRRGRCCATRAKRYARSTACSLNRDCVHSPPAVRTDMGAAYGTAKSGMGIQIMGVQKPELVMKSVIPVVMAGVIGIYGLIIAVIIGNKGACSACRARETATPCRARRWRLALGARGFAHALRREGVHVAARPVAQCCRTRTGCQCTPTLRATRPLRAA
mgnify:CR=1 FL=1